MSARASPTGEIVFFRSAFAPAPLIAWLGWRGEVADAFRTNLGPHVKRSLIGSAAMFSGFVALSHPPLPDCGHRLRRR